MPAMKMAEAFQKSSLGRAAAEELAQPPQRTKQGAPQNLSPTPASQGTQTAHWKGTVQIHI